ncbi:hypothetical protein [Dasychira pudibunda nucleopolyhedrovirus]|nr:hypothetical protein [Dasychira pudibunda nucleopolyhedrovirus]WHM28431.1 hypothetical protein [Dasychira pudibunda nucleopolyhedrovirus]
MYENNLIFYFIPACADLALRAQTILKCVSYFSRASTPPCFVGAIVLVNRHHWRCVSNGDPVFKYNCSSKTSVC